MHKKNPTRQGWYDSGNCLYCDNKLPPGSRSDRLYCDDTCRKAYSRQRANIDRTLGNLMSDLQSVRNYLKRSRDKQHVAATNATLKRLREEVHDILRLRDQETIQDAADRADLIAGLRKDN